MGKRSHLQNGDPEVGKFSKYETMFNDKCLQCLTTTNVHTESSNPSGGVFLDELARPSILMKKFRTDAGKHYCEEFKYKIFVLPLDNYDQK